MIQATQLRKLTESQDGKDILSENNVRIIWSTMGTKYLLKGSGQSPKEPKELQLEHITLIIDFITNFEHWGCILNKFPYHLNLSEQLDIHWDIKMSSPSEFTATK